jgi:cytochrome c5
MSKNIITNLLLSLLVTSLVGCGSYRDEHVRSTDEIRSQIDSSDFKQAALQYNQGKQLFSNYCNTCHYAPEKHVLDQYTFDNLFQRLPTPAEDYFIQYISDSKALKASGNKYAKQVDEVYKSAYEHHFKDSLSTRDFSNLITYIKIAAKQRYQNQGG